MADSMVVVAVFLLKSSNFQEGSFQEVIMVWS